MIESISLQGINPYVGEQSKLENLKQVNYIYGVNGAGKTSISEYLRVSADAQDGRIEWSDSQRPPVCVYNSHYIDKMFRANEIPGVFTLGEDSIEVQETIRNITEKIDAKERAKDNLGANLTQKNDELGKVQTAYCEDCWNARKRLTKEQQRAFSGHNGSKVVFAAFISKIKVPADFGGISDDEMKSMAERASGDPIPVLDYLEQPSCEEFDAIERNELMEKSIVGSEAVDVSSLIAKLGNAGWVEQGLEFYRQTDMSTCPFCQQPTSLDLSKTIQDYFDESYRSKKEAFGRLVREYENGIDSCRMINGNLGLLKENGFDVFQVFNCLTDLDNLASSNLEQMHAKEHDLGRSLLLDSTAEARRALQKAIQSLNSEIEKWNDQASDFESYKQEAFETIRCQVAFDLRSIVTRYRKFVSENKKAVDSLSAKQKKVNEEIVNLKHQREELSERLTSVKPTVNEINRMLKSLAFNSFCLDTANDGNDYRLSRPDGSAANETLSEGEKTFITFLYFLSYVKSRAQEHPIVVIDDPISSLDANVMYVVSSLVRDFAGKARDSADSDISQLLVLTHNASFHHEITFPSSGYSLKNSAYYVIRKTANAPQLVAYGDENPVTTGYEALWLELAGNEKSISIRNTMRRILETYFGFIGGQNLNTVISALPTECQSLGRSLLLWSHSGSHTLTDDLECSDCGSYAGSYLPVFCAIFEASNQLGHLRYMAKKVGLELPEEYASI